MPLKYERKSLELVSTTAESLKKAVEQLTQVASEMQQHGMKEALLPWTQRQWDCLDVVVTMANQCLAVLPAQVIAKTQNRPSKYEAMQEKSKRDVANRRARDAGAPPKPRGRPKKKKST